MLKPCFRKNNFNQFSEVHHRSETDWIDNYFLACIYAPMRPFKIYHRYRCFPILLNMKKIFALAATAVINYTNFTI